MLFLETTLCENSDIPSKRLAFPKTEHQVVSQDFLSWVFFFLLLKNHQQDTTAFNNTGNAFVSLNRLVENISHFPPSCEQNLICTSQALSVSNLNRDEEITRSCPTGRCV